MRMSLSTRNWRASSLTDLPCQVMQGRLSGAAAAGGHCSPLTPARCELDRRFIPGLASPTVRNTPRLRMNNG